MSIWSRGSRPVDEAVALCGIVSREGRPAPHVPGSEKVDYRDVSAVVRKSTFARTEPTEADVAAYFEPVADELPV